MIATSYLEAPPDEADDEGETELPEDNSEAAAQEYADITLNCRDCCNAEFLFSAGEREFYLSKGYTREHHPTRCTECNTAARTRPYLSVLSAGL